MVGQAGEGQGFDGNGPFLRLAAPGGVHAIETGKTNYTGRLGVRQLRQPAARARARPSPATVPPLRA